MRTWLLLLGGLIVWTIHFFALYIFGSVFLTTPTARALTIAFTLACLAADGVLLFVATRRARPNDELDRWVHSLAIGGIGLSIIAVSWQGLPALFR